MKRLFLILAIASVLLAGPVQAQEAPRLASLTLSLWPEYDRPEVLVIYRGELDADVALPVQLEIALPARIGQPTAVAYVDEVGQRLNQPYTTRTEGASLIVSFELGANRFQLEYYDALPAETDGKRTYAFAYTADYDTTALNLDVQQPPTAEGFLLTPPADAIVQGDDGLTYHLAEAGAIAAGDTREWTVSYVKDNTELSEDSVIPAPVQASATPVASADDARDPTIWIFLVAFVTLIAVGVTGYWLGHRTQAGSGAVQPVHQPQKRRGSGKGQQSPQSRSRVGIDQRVRFCHQCGSELRSLSEFCHVCGSQVRDE